VKRKELEQGGGGAQLGKKSGRSDGETTKLLVKKKNPWKREDCLQVERWLEAKKGGGKNKTISHESGHIIHGR